MGGYLKLRLGRSFPSLIHVTTKKMAAAETGHTLKCVEEKIIDSTSLATVLFSWP